MDKLISGASQSNGYTYNEQICSSPVRSRIEEQSEPISPRIHELIGRFAGCGDMRDRSPSTQSPQKRRASSVENKENSPPKRHSPGQGQRPVHTSPDRVGLREIPDAVNRVGRRAILARSFNDRLKELDEMLSTSDKILASLRSGGSISDLRAIMNGASKEEFADVVQQLFKNPLSSDHKRKLRNLLCSQFPIHRKFFQFEEGFDDRFPLPNSVRFIVNYLQTQQVQDKAPPISLACTIFDTPNQFVEYVQNKSREEQSISEVLFVRCNFPKIDDEPQDDLDELSVHITPLLLEKTDDGSFILIWTDSVSDDGYLENELMKISTHFETSGQRLDIFSMPKKISARQGSTTDCSIFAIQDAISYSRHHDELLQNARQIMAQEPESLRHSLQGLPHRFFWLTQKSALASNVQAGLEGEDLQKFNRKYKKHLIEKSLGKTRNLRADRIGDKYEGMIWHHIITNN